MVFLNISIFETCLRIHIRLHWEYNTLSDSVLEGRWQCKQLSMVIKCERRTNKQSIPHNTTVNVKKELALNVILSPLIRFGQI